MFERYVAAKNEKRAAWVTVTYAVSIGAHALAALALIVWSFWKIEKLEPKYVAVSFVAAGAAPPPPPPPPPPKKSATKTEVKKPKVVQELTQPTKVEPTKPEESDKGEDEGEEGGVEGGVAGGVAGGVVGGTVGGVVGGVVGGTGVAPPPEAPAIVPAVMIEGARIAGNKNIALSRAAEAIVKGQNLPKLSAVVKLCLSTGGVPTSITFIKSTNTPQDETIRAEMQKWRYKPYAVNGKVVAVCTSVMFNYVITR